MTAHADVMTELEGEVLQEVMNIAFGQAAADLSEVINLSVTLSVPQVQVILPDEVNRVIVQRLAEQGGLSMVMQRFSGRFAGSSVLLFPHGEGNKLLGLFGGQQDSSDVSLDVDMLAEETLVEVGNIIMGACVSKIAELLGDVVSYEPPRYYVHKQIERTVAESLAANESFAIFFRTVFDFQEYQASGSLFLIADAKSMGWLKVAVERYLAQYT